jgi:hypothetical protein
MTLPRRLQTYPLWIGALPNGLDLVVQADNRGNVCATCRFSLSWALTAAGVKLSTALNDALQELKK